MDKCIVCDNTFKRKYQRGGQKKIYCSKKCKYSNATKYTNNCKTCNKQFITSFLHKNKEYCSLACTQRHPCQLCGTIITGRKTFQSADKKYCSRQCSSIVNQTMRSKKAYVPKGFANTINKHGKLLCERCKNEDIQCLCVHHIDGNRANNDFNNLETLCANCHHKEHWGDGQKRNKNYELALMLVKFNFIK